MQSSTVRQGVYLIPDDVEFYGELSECLDWVDAHAEAYERPDVLHDLYGLEIIEVSDDEAHNLY